MAVALFLVCSWPAAGSGRREDTGDASLLVTRDYGSRVLFDNPGLAVNESSNAMRLLDGNAELETRYGGEYVQSVDGLSGDRKDGRSFDWFFAVNGIVAERGSAQFRSPAATASGGITATGPTRWRSGLWSVPTGPLFRPATTTGTGASRSTASVRKRPAGWSRTSSKGTVSR